MYLRAYASQAAHVLLPRALSLALERSVPRGDRFATRPPDASLEGLLMGHLLAYIAHRSPYHPKRADRLERPRKIRNDTGTIPAPRSIHDASQPAVQPPLRVVPHPFANLACRSTAASRYKNQRVQDASVSPAPLSTGSGSEPVLPWPTWLARSPAPVPDPNATRFVAYAQLRHVPDRATRRLSPIRACGPSAHASSACSTTLRPTGCQASASSRGQLNDAPRRVERGGEAPGNSLGALCGMPRVVAGQLLTAARRTAALSTSATPPPPDSRIRRRPVPPSRSRRLVAPGGRRGVAPRVS
ncbi:hypothetical protein RhiLY_07717 [Ceratobasidium sp. AG-Ba]|nr:hypothetical protein RhiLY_07717 [Ceratobasidium sp. AG-Ba]